MDFIEVRQNLLKEAKSSPNLLSDLAGLESYIAESYNNRSFIELLQNADDAKSSKFKIIKRNDFLFVANNGRTFNKTDLESLCRSASSKKIRGETIGYRGIGFKSVVGFAREVYLFSGNLEISFSKEKTKLEIPEASRVPLIRIPHNITYKDRETFSSDISQLQSEGFSTIFIFTGIVAQEIELEFDSIDTSSLIFLNNIIETEFCTNESRLTKLFKEQYSETVTKLSVQYNGNTTNWILSSSSKCIIGFSLSENKVQKLLPEDSRVYAFLQTEDKTGLGIIVNGDFNTDPSRKHLIFDKETLQTIKICSNHILNLIETNLKKEERNSISLINALIPHMDPRMLQFKKASFEKILIEELKNNTSIFFQNMRICPNWLNTKDYSALIGKQNFIPIKNQFYGLDGFTSFIKYLGAKEDTFENLMRNINSSEISVLGCVQLTIQIFKLLQSDVNKFDSYISDLRVFIHNENRISPHQIKQNDNLIDQSFISLLIEHGLTELDIKLFFKKYISVEYSEKLFLKNKIEVQILQNGPSTLNEWFVQSEQKTYYPSKSNIHRWRSAEENTLEVLNQNGFKLEDVSTQNIGYDLEGIDPNGNEIQIEVKSITLPGQKFKLTNNEVAVAQEKKNTYYIAIVRQLEKFIEIAFIPNPMNSLTLNRQCVQWIWECSDYEYNPIKFEI